MTGVAVVGGSVTAVVVGGGEQRCVAGSSMRRAGSTEVDVEIGLFSGVAGTAQRRRRGGRRCGSGTRRRGGLDRRLPWRCWPATPLVRWPGRTRGRRRPRRSAPSWGLVALSVSFLAIQNPKRERCRPPRASARPGPRRPAPRWAPPPMSANVKQPLALRRTSRHVGPSASSPPNRQEEVTACCRRTLRELVHAAHLVGRIAGESTP